MNPDEVISFFCTQTGVDPAQITSRAKDGDIWHTRYMLWHYMHNNMGMSATKLSKLFNRNRPSVFRGLRVFRNHLHYHKNIREEYHGILKKIEGMAEATPSENMEEK